MSIAEASIWEVDNEAYHADTTAVSNSAAKVFRQSPGMYYRQFVECSEPRMKSTPDMQIGSWTHEACLEPGKYERYVVEPDFGDMRYNVNKDKRAAWLKDYEGRPTMPGAAAILVAKMAIALKFSPLTGPFLKESGIVERSLVWTDEATGVLCKCRHDLYLPLRNWLIDIKTVGGDVDPLSWSRVMAAREYHVQAPWYVSGYHAKFGEVPEFLFMVVSKTTLETAMYRPTAAAMERGGRIMQETLRGIAACRESGEWAPAHCRRIMDVGLPKYAEFESDYEPFDLGN